MRDFDRPLNERGERSGAAMNAWLRLQAEPPTWIITSTAIRALATTAFVADAAQLPTECIDAQPDLYLANPETLLSRVRTTPADVASVALVAHNPGMTHLVNLMLDEPYLDNLPTFGVVQLHLTSPWNDVQFGQAELVQFMSPKRLP